MVKNLQTLNLNFPPKSLFLLPRKQNLLTCITSSTPMSFPKQIESNPKLIVAEGTKAARASSRQRIPRLLLNRTPQTRREGRTPTHRRHLVPVRDHAARLRRQILNLLRTLPARVGVIVIRQVDNRDLARVVAAKERRPDVQPLAQKGGRGRDDGHLGQAGELRLHVRLVDFAAVGEVGARVGRVVVDDDDADAAGGLEQGEERVVLVRFAAVDQGEFGLSLHEVGVGVLVEWVGVGGELVHEGQGMGLGYDGGQVGEDAGNLVNEGQREAQFVENVGRRSKNVAWESQLLGQSQTVDGESPRLS